jgi:TonB family protein
MESVYCNKTQRRIAMNTTVTDRRWSLLGTLIIHSTLIFLLLMFARSCGTGGGGGNGGLGYTGLMSLDAAGLGTYVDGVGYEEMESAPIQEETTSEPVVEENVTAIADDSAPAESPTISNNKPSETKPNPNNNTTTKPQEQQVSGNLNNAFGQLSKGGNGNTTGGGQQGTADGSIDGKGVLGGGGSQGSGGGQGGGDGTGTGPGTGPGSGPGSGGLNSSFTLQGRKMDRKPSINETAPDEGVVVVDIWVDKAGNVTKAIANPALSSTSNGQLYKLAEQAAKKAKFSSGTQTEQKGTIKITFKLS